MRTTVFSPVRPTPAAVPNVAYRNTPRVMAGPATHSASRAVAPVSGPAIGVHAHAGPTLADIALAPQAGAEFRRLAAEDVAWDAERDAGKIIFVRDGLLRVYHGLPGGRQRLVQLVGAGNWAGIEALAGTNGTRTKIVAAANSLIVLVDAGKFLSIAMTDPTTGVELVKQLARYSVSLNTQLTESTLLDCECQLVHTLLRLSRCGGGEKDGTRVTLRLTQQDLADALGIARETVNGMLQRLTQLQLVNKRRGRISFDLVQLEQWALHIDAAGQKLPAE
jgi:CRP/FNR family transcriptional regulator, cyclic AMP receptor protein